MCVYIYLKKKKTLRKCYDISQHDAIVDIVNIAKFSNSTYIGVGRIMSNESSSQIQDKDFSSSQFFRFFSSHKLRPIKRKGKNLI